MVKMWDVDPHVLQDPVFQELLQKHELAARKLRDATAAMRSFHLSTSKDPQTYTHSEKWSAAQLGEAVAQRLDDVREAAADLVRYAYELSPHSSSPEHLEQIQKLREEHEERVRSRTGWKKRRPEQARGIEEKVQVDGGPPITIVIKPKHYEFTERYRKSWKSKKPE